MKKRLLSALLALALVFVLLPTTALAGVTTKSDYDISIDGKRYKFDSDGSGGYTTAYYQENNGKTPTSNYEDVWQTNPYLEITRVDNIITITVKIGSKGPGKSVTIGASTQDINYECIAVNGAIDLIITGDTGTSLTLNKTYCGAALSATKGNITITDGVKVTASFKNKAVGNYVFYAIWAKNLTVSGANTEVTASGNCEDAIHVSGTVTVSKGAKLTATNDHNDKYKPYPITKSSAIKSDVLTIADENSCVIAQAIDSSYGKPLRIQNYNIAGATIKAGSSNYNSTETTIDKIDGNTYVKISIPALQRTSDVLIAGKDAVVGVETSIPSANGSGTYFYDQASKTLTLNNVTITSGTNAIQFAAAGTYTVKLEGTNKISNVSNGISVTDDKYITSLNVTITGTGSLDISAKGLAINMKKGDLKFENTGEIKLTTSNISPTHNVLSVSGNITIADMEKYKVEGIVQDNTKDGGDTVTLSEASHLKGYQNPDGTAICLKTITITPTPAKDSTISYGKKTLKQGKTITGENGGTATVDSKNNTITLDNFKGNYPLEFNAEFTPNSITLIGDSTLSAVETKYQDLTISGSGSLSVGSIRVTNNDNIRADLTITDGAAVIAKSNATRAIDIKGDLTVTNGSLTATSKSDSVPTVQVGGNASFTGSTVTITNNSTTQGERYKDSYEVSSALHVNGAITISGGEVTATATVGGNAIRAVKDITVSDGAQVTATNNSQHFSAITAGQASGGVVSTAANLIVSGEGTKIHAQNNNADSHNLGYGGAIYAKIKNANESNYLNITGCDPVAPNDEHRFKRDTDITITRGDKVARTPSPVVIDGTTLLNDTYYTITDGSTVVANGSKGNYNAIYDSANKTLKLNNAKISTTTENAAIKISEDSTITTITVTGTNELKGNHNHCIESYDNFTINGTGTLNMTNTNSSSSATSVIHCGPGKSLTIAAEVIIKNEAKPGNLIFTVEKDAYSFAEGYNVYASTDVSGSPLETYDAAKSSTYKYLRVTKENLAPTTPTPQTPFTIYGIPAQFVDGGMIATTGVTATSSNNINLPIDRVKWYTFIPVFGSDGRMDSVSDKTEATGNFEAGKYYVVEIKFVQDLSPFKSWDMKVSGWSDNDVYRQSVTARNDIEIYFLTPASAATHEHNWAENYDTVYHWKMCTYDGCTAIKDKALHVWNAWHTSNNEQQHWKSCSECSYSTPPHDIDLAYVSDGEQGHHLYCKHDGCTFVTGTTAHVYAEGSNICTDCGYNKSAPCDHTGDRAYTNNGDGTHKVTCIACGATIVEKQNHEFNPTGVCIYCGATQSGGDPTPDNPGTIVIIRPAEEEKPAQQPNPSTGANDLVGLAVAAAVAAALGSAALLRKHD